MKKCVSFCATSSAMICCLVLVAMVLAQPLNAQISVTSTTPNTASQGTINLNVTISGKGFKNGAKAKWFISGTTDPGGVVVNSTAFVNSTTLTANITVSDTAVIANFDVAVTNADGRTGKGTELFAVTQKGAGSASSCTPITTMNIVANACPGPGCLDTTFAGGVEVIDTNPGSSWLQSGRRVVIQNDAKIAAIVGSAAVVRLFPDGTLDSSFANDGVARLDARLTGLSAFAVQPDGKYVLAGAAGNSTIAIVRLQPDGTYDASFGSTGVFTFTMSKTVKGSSFTTANGVAVQRDGKIVVTGYGKDSRFLVLRLNSNGTLDTSFGSSGQATVDFGLNDNQFGRDMLLQDVQVPGGATEQRILIAGDVKGTNTTRDFGVVRLLPTGQQDLSFGNRGNGTTVLDFCSADEVPLTVRLDPNGRIWLGGSGQAGSTTIGRLTPNGMPDSTFGAPDPNTGSPTGKMRLQVNSGSINSLSIDTSGRVSVLSDYASYQGVTARLLPDGSIDASYASGYVMYPDGYAFLGSAVQPDGALAIVGWRWSDSKFAVARLLQ